MKKVMMLLCVLFLLLPAQAFAHSKLTESYPANNETLTSSPEEITLTFNTSISSVSTFTLLNENGDLQDVSDITVNDSKLSGKVISPLANGSYTIEWNIIGADGHAIKGSTPFVVQATEAAPAPSSTPIVTEEAVASSQPIAEASSTPTDEGNNATTNTNSANESEAPTNETEQNNNNPIWPFAIIAIIIVAIVAVAFKKRK